MDRSDNTRVVLPSSTSFGWGKGGNVTSAGWQETLCDPIWHVSTRSGEASGVLRTAILRLLYFTLLYFTLYRDRLDKLERRSRLSMRSNPSGTCEAEALLATSPAVSVCTPSTSPSLSSAVSHSTTAGMNVADSGHDIVSRAAAVCQAQFLPFRRERIARRI